MTKIVSWNVNSINARLERLIAFLKRESPDYLCLQELKCAEEKYPFAEIKVAGYESTIFGQKTYNGVAVLAKKSLAVKARNFGDSNTDENARFISVEADGFTLMCAYVPNGQDIGTEKYIYKLEWLHRAREYFDRHHRPGEKLVIVGDFNIAPDDRDVYDPVAWNEKILCSTKEREALSRLISFGLVDTFRMHHEEGNLFTWWDYRDLGFPRNKGLRIDHIYATPPMAMRCTSVRIDRDERRGDKPSDHAPVIAEFKL